MNARSSRFARRLARRLFATTLTIPGIVLAQSWPTKPVRLVVPFVAGGSADAVARTIAQKVGQNTGQQFVVDNRPGASGAMGSGEVVGAAADGYTLLFTTSSTHAIAPNLVAKLPYNSVGDFTAIAHLADAPLVLLVAPNVEANDGSGTDRPGAQTAGRLNYGSSGNGTITHLTSQAFKAQANVSITHIPYKGGAQALPDLVAGNVAGPVRRDSVGHAARQGSSGTGPGDHESTALEHRPWAADTV